MRKIARRFLCLLLVAVLALSLVPLRTPVSAVSTGALGELLDSFSASDETFTVSSSSRLYVVAEAAPTGDLLQTAQLIQQQFAAMGTPVPDMPEMVWGLESWAKDGDLVLKLDANSGLAEDAYSLNVGSVATITASNVRGLVYGSNMLMKHLRYAQEGTIQGFSATDTPDTVQRAVSMDCGRKYYTKDWICNFIRQMSWMGYNTLQFHFSDDSGFRFDLWDEEYYKGQFQPKNDFTWICGSNYTSWTLSAYQNDADKGKFLTTAEVVEILETAKEYHIDVIPSFDSPSHVDYLTWKFEQNYNSNSGYSFYSTYDGKTYYAKDVNGIINYTNSKGWSTPLQWPYYSAVNVKSAQAKAFIFELYTDIANFFKEYAGSVDFSIGADEVQLNTANINTTYYSYAWGFADFVSYINELNKLLNKLGYTVRMYNDFMGSVSYGASNYSFDSNIEIMYWDSPFNPNTGTNKNHTEPVSYHVNQGRILYNCIQTNTYYALRISDANDDARSKNTTWWTFYHATEDRIWDEWYSADISEHGTYSEDVADVPAANLGGAYFLIWCDYACVSTEQEIWNGCYDFTTKNNGEYYSLIDRMWSNITKMWNSDINSDMTYSEFAALRDEFGLFPGIGSGTNACSTKVTLPTATAEPEQAYLADHSALTAELNKALPLDASAYTQASYAAYTAARTTAEAVNADHGATAEQLQAQVDALVAARNALERRPTVVTVVMKSVVGGSTKTIGTLSGYSDKGNGYFEIYIPRQIGYSFKSCEGATFQPLASGDGSGYVCGNVTGDTTITVWFDHLADTTRVEAMLSGAESAQGSYSDASWSAYQAALSAAKSLVSNGATQSELDAAAQNITDAHNKLVISGVAAEILNVQVLNPTVICGKQVALRVTTSAGVESLSVEGETFTKCTAQIQNTEDGVQKIWLVYFPADEAGTFTYTLNAGDQSVQFQIQVN